MAVTLQQRRVVIRSWSMRKSPGEFTTLELELYIPNDFSSEDIGKLNFADVLSNSPGVKKAIDDAIESRDRKIRFTDG